MTTLFLFLNEFTNLGLHRMNPEPINTSRIWMVNKIRMVFYDIFIYERRSGWLIFFDELAMQMSTDAAIWYQLWLCDFSDVTFYECIVVFCLWLTVQNCCTRVLMILESCMDV